MISIFFGRYGFYLYGYRLFFINNYLLYNDLWGQLEL